MTDQPTLAQRVSSSLAQLSMAGDDLNAVFDDLGLCVADIDAALKQLNLGISVWVKMCAWGGDLENGDCSFWNEDLGFTKIKGKWGIWLRRVDGDISQPEQKDIEEWLFGDAPRTLRLQAVDKLPDLIEKLNTEAVRITRELQAKLSDVQALAAVVNPNAKASAPMEQVKLNGGLKWGGGGPDNRIV